MKKITFMFSLVFLFSACVANPITGRSALILLPLSEEIDLGAQAYKEILSEKKVSRDIRLNSILKRVGRRIAMVS